MTDLTKLNPDTIARLQALHQKELERRKLVDPAGYFPWHEIQDWVLTAPKLAKKSVRIILVAGGNRGGKSKVGMGLYSQVLRRESALNRQFKTTDSSTGAVRIKNRRDPLTVWIVPPTLEKARQDWILPQDQMGLKFWQGNLFLKHERQPDNIFYTLPPGYDRAEFVDDAGNLREDKKHLCDKTIIKSQDQKLETFESSEVDLVIFDEEVQNEAVWNSCLMRIATTNGTIAMTYTPLHGLSWSYHRYWKHLVEGGAADMIQDRCWLYDPKKGATVICAQMGSRDNPRAREYADEIEHDPEMAEAEKKARLYGQYGFVEGALVPALAGLDVVDPIGTHRQYVVDALPGQRNPATGEIVPGRIVRWLLVTDPNKSYGAILSAVDADGNLFYVTEHLEEAWPDRKHAIAFKQMEKDFARGRVERYADPGSAGAQSIVNMMDLGLNFNTMPKGAGSVSNSIKKLRGLAYVDPLHTHPITGVKGAPRVYFYRPGMVQNRVDGFGRPQRGCETARQIAQARQTDNPNAPPDTPHKDIRSKLDLFDCARYTAILASDMVVPDEDPRGAASSRENHLPSDEVLRKHEDDLSPGHSLDTPFYLPTYDFSSGGVS